jgi:hypothetical protein
MDGVKNGNETGIDCGGGTCPTCAAAQGCKVDSDCASGVCKTSVCQSPTCTDGVQNGTETDVDCGGATCDAQGHVCAFGKKCTAGADCATTFCVNGLCDAQVVASGQSGPRGIAVDFTNVYFTTYGGGTIVQIPLTTLTAQTLATGETQPAGIALDSSNVYWRNAGGGSIRTVRINGGMAAQNVVTGIGIGFDVAVDVMTVYWSDDTGVSSAPKFTGTPKTLLSSVRAQNLALDSGHIYWTTDRGGTSPSLVSYTFSNMTSSNLAVGVDTSYGVAVDAANVYWSGQNGVYKVPLGGGTNTTLATYFYPADIAIDATYVYVIRPCNGACGEIHKVPIAGGTDVILAPTQSTPSGIAVDQTHVYWTNYGDGTVKRVHK